jgi:hypothetical protein
MSYVNRPVDDTVINETTVVPRGLEYHDRARWVPILSGFVVAVASQLVLSAFGTGIGFTNLSNSNRPIAGVFGVSNGIGIWTGVSFWLALLIGGWVTARSCGPMNRSTAILNGAILWGTTLAIGSWLLASGVSGGFSVIASTAGAVANQVQQGTIPVPNSAPSITPQQARNLASTAAWTSWWFIIGSVIGLIMAMIGAAAGARKPRTYS